MPRTTLNEELDLIESIVASHPAGIGISALEAEMERRLGTPPQRRTLQRRLLKLIEEQRLVTEGESIVLVYKPAAGGGSLSADTAASAALAVAETALADTTDTQATQATPAEPAPVPAELEVPLSMEGAGIAAQVRRAPMYRRPIGYQPEFLQAYQPGETFYLPEPLRRHLQDLGHTAQGAQPAGPLARDLQERLLVDLSWASSRLAGNTYSRPEAQKLIALGRIALGKAAIETQMLLNHQAALEMLLAEGDEVALDAFTFKNLHAVLSQELLPDPHASGRLRQRPLEIAGTVFEPLAVPALLQECFALLLEKAAAIPDPLEQAFFLLVQLPFLQPFDAANQRVARMGANIPLLQHRLCPLSFIDVPQGLYHDAALGVCELHDVALLRDLFVWAYERSCQRYLEPTHPLGAAPDPLKIQYREALIQAVQTIVQGQRPASPATVQQLAQEHAQEPHRAVFADLLTAALQQLHEGSIARYRLRRAEYLAWQQRPENT